MNGATEKEFKELVAGSGRVTVVCRQRAVFSSGHYKGIWEVFAYSVDDRKWRILFTQDRSDRRFGVRTFKTLNGMCSFLKGLGFEFCALTFEAGSSIEINLDGSVRFMRVHRDH